MFSAGLIGAGNIGALYDLHSHIPSTLSHVTKLLRDDRIDLKFVIERKRSVTLAELETQNYTSVSEAPKISLDMIVVCVNTENLVDCAIEAAIKFTPKCLVIEKPVSCRPSQVQRLKEFCDANDIKVFVNFMRRYLPEVQQMREMFACSTDSQFFVECNFGSSMLNNGIHYLDLHQHFFGAIRNIETIYKTGKYDLYLVRSNNAEGIYRNDHGAIVRDDNFSVSNSFMRARYMNGGQIINVDKAVAGPLFPSLKQYFYSQTLKSNIAHYMDYFYEAVIESWTSSQNSQLDDLIKLLSLVVSLNHGNFIGDNR